MRGAASESWGVGVGRATERIELRRIGCEFALLRFASLRFVCCPSAGSLALLCFPPSSRLALRS